MYAIVLEGGVMLHVELELIIYKNNTNDFKDILRIEATRITSLHIANTCRESGRVDIRCLKISNE